MHQNQCRGIYSSFYPVKANTELWTDPECSSSALMKRSGGAMNNVPPWRETYSLVWSSSCASKAHWVARETHTKPSCWFSCDNFCLWKHICRATQLWTMCVQSHFFFSHNATESKFNLKVQKVPDSACPSILFALSYMRQHHTAWLCCLWAVYRVTFAPYVIIDTRRGPVEGSLSSRGWVWWHNLSLRPEVFVYPIFRGSVMCGGPSGLVTHTPSTEFIIHPVIDHNTFSGQ